MSGVSTVQWRGSIGLFNVQKNPQRTSVDNHKPFLISSNLKKYLNFFHVRLSLVLSLIYSIILLFGLSCMAITLFVLITFIHLGFGYFICPDSVFSCRNISYTLYLVFSFPKFIYFLVINPMKNIAFQLLVLGMLLIMAGIESNPGPTSKKNLSFAMWNLDSLPARNYARIPLIESLQAEYKFDMFGVCESALTGNISNDSISVEGFSLDPIRADKADDTRNGGVCLYFREDLPIKSRPDLATIPETIVAEIKINRKKNIFCLVLPPSKHSHC